MKIRAPRVQPLSPCIGRLRVHVQQSGSAAVSSLRSSPGKNDRLLADVKNPGLPPSLPSGLVHSKDRHQDRGGTGLSLSTSRFFLAAAMVFTLAGCGTPGAPQPPSLKLPIPPADLSASRSADLVNLRWTMPERATDRVLLSGDQHAVICRGLAAAACQPVGEMLLLPGTSGSFTDVLPESLRTGPPRLLIYSVLLKNATHHGAGPSNLAYSAAGAAPPPIKGLHADAEARGIVLRWAGSASAPTQATTLAALASSTMTTPAGQQALAADGDRLLRLHRTRLVKSGEATRAGSLEIQSGLPQPFDQLLQVKEPPTPGLAPADATLADGWTLAYSIDRDSALNHTYRYTVEEVAQLVLDGHPMEVSSGLSTPAVVDARDLFPPAAPRDMEAVASSDAGTIDLSWTADTEGDLAGYAVYRRVAGSNQPPERVSGKSPLPNTAWRDQAARPGVRYAYSVSAIDSSGNESARCPEAEETLPPVTAPVSGATPGPASSPATRPDGAAHS